MNRICLPKTNYNKLFGCEPALMKKKITYSVFKHK